MTRPAAVAFTASALLAGCAPGTADVPSLLPRPIEATRFDEPPTAPATAAPDPALDAAIADARRTLAAAAEGFGVGVGSVASLIDAARGAGAGSEAWLDAQIALGTLDDQRATSVDTLSRLDDLAIARGGAGRVPYPALDALRAEAQAQVQAETARIAELSAQLPAG